MPLPAQSLGLLGQYPSALWFLPSAVRCDVHLATLLPLTAQPLGLGSTQARYGFCHSVHNASPSSEIISGDLCSLASSLAVTLRLGTVTQDDSKDSRKPHFTQKRLVHSGFPFHQGDQCPSNWEHSAGGLSKPNTV